MPLSLSTRSVPVDSIVIKQVSSEQPITTTTTTTVLHPSTTMRASTPSHHLYNYWTLNERLRSKNEKLVKRQHVSCRLIFCCLWLFVLGGVMIIIVYRFTDECSLLSPDRTQLVLRCFRHLLLFAAVSLSVCGCSGIVFGACRYFRSQPKPFVDKEKYELQVSKAGDASPAANTRHACCYQSAMVNGLSRLPSQRISNPTDEHSNTTASSSLPHPSPLRKMPPFTYEELPANPSSSHSPLSPLSIVPNVIVNSNSANPNRGKSAFFSTSTSSSSSSPRSNLSTTLMPHTCTPTSTAGNHAQSNAAATPTSYPTCACGHNVWERRTILYAPR